MRVVLARGFATATLLLTTLIAVCRGEDLKTTTSLRFVPADAGFYMSSMRLEEQYNKFIKSRAYDRLYNMPSVQLGLNLLQAQYRSKTFAPLRDFLKKKANKDLVDLLQDAGTQEIFAYSDPALIESFALIQEISNDVRFAQMQAGIAGEEDEEAQKKVIREIVARLLKSKDKLRFSPIVFGAKITKPEVARAQLDRLEKMADENLPSIEQAKFEVSRQQIAGGDFLTISLALKSIDWTDLESEIDEDVAEEVKPLLDHLKSKTLLVSLGVRDGYFFFTAGESNDHLKLLGQGKTLADVPDFQKIFPHQDQKITNIWYSSRRLIEIQQQAAAGQIMALSGVVRQAMDASNTPDATKEAFEKDLKSLEERVKQETTGTPHATVGCSFLTDRGTESFQYEVGGVGKQTGTPLPILSHVGGSPLLFAVTRSQASPDEYKEMRPTLQRILGYVDTTVLSNIDEDDKGEYEHFRQLAVPYLKRFDVLLGDYFVPALQDGQIGLVIDAKATSTQWFRDMPEASEPLPMLELGIVLGLSDQDKFLSGMDQLYTFVGDLMKTIQAESPDDLPEIDLPAWSERGVAGGNVYLIEIPKAAGVDDQLAGTLGVGSSYAIFTTSIPQAERVILEKPFQFEGPLAGKTNLLSVQHVNFAGFIDALVPWINYGFAQIPQEEGAASGFGVNAIHGQVESVLSVLRCYRGTTAIRYAEKDAIVTHTESRFVDLEEQQ
ncbi:hypothetical protein [Planctomyces sp. SH-PL14]|uniref:hypothetical protein n=1 Tax=Planctomyces sp. SH-PL14 TaxID=1632864 RepID=UPI00078D1F9E|nr:hypothetical protein [Planctomyces sp. SH-PL14]AMV19997.1 hypothetical protein VT03_19015 [Planctomyces sp. SH-PL14]